MTHFPYSTSKSCKKSVKINNVIFSGVYDIKAIILLSKIIKYRSCGRLAKRGYEELDLEDDDNYPEQPLAYFIVQMDKKNVPILQ